MNNTGKVPQSKIIDILREKQKDGHHRPVISFEFFPPRQTDSSDVVFLEAVGELVRDTRPDYIDVTWKAGGGSREHTLKLCCDIYDMYKIPTLMHVACRGLIRDELREFLESAATRGIRNILALYGDPIKDDDPTRTCDTLHSSVEFVQFIRETFGDVFCIGVTGYPESDNDVSYVKQKISVGGEFVITQMCHNAHILLSYITKCREVGVNCPIIPGVLVMSSYHGFCRMMSLCNLAIPERIQTELEPLKDDPIAFQDAATTLTSTLCDELLDGEVDGIHLFTMNAFTNVQRCLSKIQSGRIHGTSL